MFRIYVLKSLRNSKKYIGFTSKEVSARLEEHNSGTNSWTRQNRPFELIYSENFNSEHEARAREKFLKSGQGRKYLNDILCPGSSTG
ncbi:MAG: GIY-YIG nuclease family protein [Candidatus Omnitrophica bacterium]|nr:GIY-YIG nuclease family protein [Candidatus Omnitrophota bacterium]